MLIHCVNLNLRWFKRHCRRFIPKTPSRKVWEDNEDQWTSRWQKHGVCLWSWWNREGKPLHV